MATKRYTPNLLRAVALGSGLAFATIAATGCASDVTAPADVVPVVTPVHASIQRYSREIHFDLGKSVPNARYELELGGATYPVNAHDASSLARYHAKATRLLASGRAPTHYVTGARFSKSGGGRRKVDTPCAATATSRTWSSTSAAATSRSSTATRRTS